MRRLDINSETARELDPDLAQWGGTPKTNALLADIYDMLAMINANICAMGTGKRAVRPKKYPRPGDKQAQKIGKNALPPDELRDFFKRKRQEHIKRYGR